MKALLALAILLALPGAAAADWQPAEVYVICVSTFGEFDVLTAVQFAIANLPEASMAQVTAYWNTDLVIGDLETGIALAFSPPLALYFAVLGRVEFIAWEPFPDDYVMEVVGAPAWDDELLVVDGEYNEIEAQGGIHTFNCTEGCYCGNWLGAPLIGLFTDEEGVICYQDIEVFTTPAGESSWSAVKALY